MKKFFFILLTSLTFYGFSQERVYCDLEHVLRVSKSNIKEKFCVWPDSEEQFSEYPYKTENIGGITYYFFNNKKYLVLSCPELFYAFESNEKVKYMLNSKSGMASEVISTLCKEHCEYSSALKENGREYAFSISDSFYPKLREPWVEGKKG